MTEKEVIKEPFQEEIKAETLVHKNGQYTNIYLNDYKGHKGLRPGQFITVKKHDQFNEPRTLQKDGQYGPYNLHMCTVVVGDQDATFVTFQDREAESFTEVAGLEDTIQISKQKYTYVDARGTERVKEELVFRKVE